MRIILYIKLSLLGILLLNLSGCTTMLAGSSAAVVSAVAQERSLGNAVDDAAIWSRIKSAFFNEKADNHQLLSLVNIKVSEGRVLLTGEVPSAKDKLKAVKIVWKQNGVKEVMNEITIADPNDKSNKVKSYATDSWITTQIKSKMLLSGNINSINYSVETLNGIVYLMGLAQNQTELDAVTTIAGKTKNVQKVISYIRLKNSKIRKEMLDRIE